MVSIGELDGREKDLVHFAYLQRHNFWLDYKTPGKVALMLAHSFFPELSLREKHRVAVSLEQQEVVSHSDGEA